MASSLIKPGSKWFIPAEHKKSSHESVKDICVNRGFAVFVVNGTGIRLTLPDRRLFMYKKDDELNKKIRDICSEHSLDRYPMAITGNICIGRGISILSEEFMIDYGILSSCHNQQEASQNSGRLKGNIKHWPSYKPPIVFTTERFSKIAGEWEKKSRNLAELAFRKESAGEETIITKNEFKTLGEKFEYKIEDELFKSFTLASRFLKGKRVEMGAKPNITTMEKSAIQKVDGGYMVTSKLLTVGKTVADLCPGDRVTEEGAHKIAASRCISSTDKGSRYLILPVYKSMDTPPNQAKFQVRYISLKK